MGKMFDEAAVEVTKPKKRLYVPAVNRNWPIDDTFNLDRVHPNLPFRYKHPQVLSF
jgi:hypothetical protein